MSPFDDRLDCDSRWFKRFSRRGEPAQIRLLCFHHAGGSAAMYRQWPRLVAPSVEPVAVQLPGRADRFHESAYDRMEPLVNDLIDAVKPMLDQPFACYGVSMGARVAWALAHALRERAMPLPRMLFVAASTAPKLDGEGWEWEGREDGLLGYVREMGGTPPEVLAEPELMRALLTTLRADLEVLTTHSLRPAAPLELPIHAFAGADDHTAGPEHMVGWREETSTGFDLDVVPSGHFLDSTAERQVVRMIYRDLA